MMDRFTSPLVTLLALFLMGQACPIDSPVTDPYCAGSPLPAMALPAINQGTSSCTDTHCVRRSTMYVKPPINTSCTGTAVGPRTILTAAHCLVPSIDPVFRMGTRGVGHTGVGDARLEWESVGPPGGLGWHGMAHPGWPFLQGAATGITQHDMALITVDRDLPPPYALPYQSIQSPECTGLILQAFGDTDPDPDVLDKQGLRETPVRLQAPRSSAETGWTIHLEGTLGDSGALGGDSGGPVYATMADGTYRLAAVITNGDGIETYGQKITREKWQWVQDNLGVLPPDPLCLTASEDESATDTITNSPAQTSATATLSVGGYVRVSSVNSFFGLSSGAASVLADQAVSIRCNASGYWDVWDGAAAWQATNQQACTLNRWHLFRIDVDVAAETFEFRIGDCFWDEADPSLLPITRIDADMTTGATHTPLTHYSYYTSGGGQVDLHSVTWSAP